MIFPTSLALNHLLHDLSLSLSLSLSLTHARMHARTHARTPHACRPMLCCVLMLRRHEESQPADNVSVRTVRSSSTRESTATLKAWLRQHIKNPYPSKVDKIMLAIITRMTLTQVSTWFANARRRLKKDSGLCWQAVTRKAKTVTMSSMPLAVLWTTAVTRLANMMIK